MAGLIAVSGTVIALPLWFTGCTNTPHVLIRPGTPETEALIGAIVDTILPPGEEGKSPGARASGVDKYLTRNVFDTLGPAERANVYTKLQEVEEESERAFEVSFVSADKMEREAVLLKFAGSPDKGDRDFYEMLKRETIKGFQNARTA